MGNWEQDLEEAQALSTEASLADPQALKLEVGHYNRPSSGVDGRLRALLWRASMMRCRGSWELFPSRQHAKVGCGDVPMHSHPGTD